ncbi:carbohydrate kinase family protein [Pseudoalteromonas viridis]|uniref:Carbohydrate kinase n=1 Tax=Pseudoalteromonas viridis TaxID=339617 RepID=A0ABX7VAM8_9GAMM|nr:carbohydrate kinase [Pseudoalteromonas viridis]QTL37994.1 carbohydrate kinase [Pseudoalteromonas viridis]
MSLVCFGEALIDFLSDGKTPESFTKYAGGAPANVAVAAARQGIAASFCGMVGDDMFGRFIKQELQSHGVNCDYVSSTDKAKTALAFVSLDSNGERSFSFYRPPAADLLFRSDDFDPSMFDMHSLIHVCSNSLTETNIYKTTVHALTQARAQGMNTSFDMNLRENLWTSMTHCSKRIWHVISLSDIVKLSQEELVFLNEQSHPGQPQSHTLDAIMAANVKLLIITDGKQAVRFYGQTCQGEVQVPDVTAVDTTAAGDAFVGGLLATFIRSDLPIDTILASRDSVYRAIEYASRCGAFAVTRYGAFDSLPSYKDIA